MLLLTVEWEQLGVDGNGWGFWVGWVIVNEKVWVRVGEEEFVGVDGVTGTWGGV